MDCLIGIIVVESSFYDGYTFCPLGIVVFNVVGNTIQFIGIAYDMVAGMGLP